MKIAIFHNYMDNIGGAEIVTLILARELKADIYTTNIAREKIEKMGFSADNIYSIGKIPLNPPLRQEFAYWKFRKLNLGKKYDFYIICGDWALSGAVRNKPNMWYVHSPIREVWDLYKYTRKNIVSSWKRPVFDVWVFFRRIIIRHDIKKIEKLLCNSKNVRDRIKKYFNREAIVIYPPVETEKFYYRKNENFWLSVNRLINSKRVEMQLRAFAEIPEEKLIVIGPCEKAKHFQTYADYCKKIKPENVEIINEISREKLIELFAGCKGIISTAVHECLGMNVIEAMASGKPVIAPNEGGYKETIINGKTGILIDDINEEKLAKAVKKISEEIENNPSKYIDVCRKQAKKFDAKIFIKKIEEQINC